jgi:hypothetical protein
MAGHPRLLWRMLKDVDARHKAGHDELLRGSRCYTFTAAFGQ